MQNNFLNSLKPTFLQEEELEQGEKNTRSQSRSKTDQLRNAGRQQHKVIDDEV